MNEQVKYMCAMPDKDQYRVCFLCMVVCKTRDLTVCIGIYMFNAFTNKMYMYICDSDDLESWLFSLKHSFFGLWQRYTDFHSDTQLPAGHTFTTLYDDYTKCVKERGFSGTEAVDKPYSYENFTLQLHPRFPQVTKGRQTAFSQCTTCHTFIQLRSDKSLSAEQRERVRELHDGHIRHFIGQRMHYDRRIMLSSTNSNIASIAVDTMSQWSTELPRMKGRPSTAARDLPRVPCAITLLRWHGHRDVFYLNNGAVPKDSNYISGILFHATELIARDCLAKKKAMPRYANLFKVASLANDS